MKNVSNESKVKKPFYKKWWFWGIVIVIIIGGLGSGSDTKQDKDTSTKYTNEVPSKAPKREVTTKEPVKNNDEQKETGKQETTKPKKYTTKVTAGYYEGGVQLPSGNYDITLLSGQGNVFSSSGLNEIFSSDSSLGISKYNNFYLSCGDVLNVAGNLNLRITCKEADMDSLSKLDNKEASEKKLEAGKYVAGVDFNSGVYDIVHIKGNGNVFVDDGDVVNEMFGSGDEMYINRFKNCTFSEGTTIELSGVSVKLVPSNCQLQK